MATTETAIATAGETATTTTAIATVNVITQINGSGNGNDPLSPSVSYPNFHCLSARGDLSTAEQQSGNVFI